MALALPSAATCIIFENRILESPPRRMKGLPCYCAGVSAMLLVFIVRLQNVPLNGIEEELLPVSVSNRCSHVKTIQHLSQDHCYSPEGRSLIRECSHSDSNHTVYQITRIHPTAQPLTNDTIGRKLLIAFIHVNKAGGSTIKRSVLFPSIAKHRWDAGAFGTFKAWKDGGLGTPWMSDAVVAPVGKVKYSDIQEPLYTRCGSIVNNPSTPFQSLHQCPLRVVWGSIAMGLCDHFPNMPCVYLITLRDPLERAISNYNYVCVEGKENRKKWLPEWKLNDFCPLDIVSFFDIFEK